MSAVHSSRCILLEVAIDSVDDALAAIDAGADRIELCSRLDLDGLTPEPGWIKLLKQQTSTPIMAMIRPRPGEFICDNKTFDTMRRQMADAGAAGADGFVFGVVRTDRTIDKARVRELVVHAGGKQTVFHRAFDQVPNSMTAMEQLINLGVTRLLTSGGEGATSAVSESGMRLLATLVARAEARIEILPAGGIRPANAKALIEHTLCTQVHSSCRDVQTRRLSTEIVRALRLVCDGK